MNKFSTWFMQAPTSSPPLLPPSMHNLLGWVYPLDTRYSAAEMKSSKQFCFFASEPALCHSSPYSPPPRMFTMQLTAAKCLVRIIRLTLNDGVKLMLNPPYPYNKHGCVPSNFKFFLAITNIGILVPSLLGKKTWKQWTFNHIGNTSGFIGRDAEIFPSKVNELKCKQR